MSNFALKPTWMLFVSTAKKSHDQWSMLAIDLVIVITSL